MRPSSIVPPNTCEMIATVLRARSSPAPNRPGAGTSNSFTFLLDPRPQRLRQPAVPAAARTRVDIAFT